MKNKSPAERFDEGNVSIWNLFMKNGIMTLPKRDFMRLIDFCRMVVF